MDRTSISKPTNRRSSRWWTTARLAQRLHTTSFKRIVQDPFLPLLILGVIGVALFALFILKVSNDIAFGVIFIGCLTAVLEIKARNDNRD